MNLYPLVLLIFALLCQSYCLFHQCQHSARENTVFIIDSQDQPNHTQNIQITFDFSSIPDNFDNREYIVRLLNQTSLFFSRNLQVEVSVKNNVFPNIQNVFCGSKLIPEQDKTVGIQNSDLHIYVGTFSNQFNNALATSGVCVLGRIYKRPSFGYLNINTFHFNNIGDVGKEREYKNYFEGILHEMFHVLGFSQSLFPHFKNSLTFENKINIESGKPTTWVTSPKVKAVARNHFSCQTAIGMQLENYNGDNKENQHWERVLLNSELMTGNYERTFGIVSIFTWALLEDSGWYIPNYEFMDDIQWGKGKGCLFLDICNPTYFREFQPKWGYSKQYFCSFYYSAVTSLHQQGYTTDKCPIGTEVIDCQDPGSKGGFYEHLFPNVYSYQSMCFESNVTDYKKLQGNEKLYLVPGFSSRCFQYECTNTGLDVIVKNQRYTFQQGVSIKVNITSETENITGIIQPPENISAFCNQFPKPCLNYCSRNGYCYAGTCHCDPDYAGEDCSVYCANGNYVYNGVCRNYKSCPENTLFNSQTKECYTGQPCPEGLVKLGHNCVSKCPIRYFKGGQSCVPCMPGCDYCKSQFYCDFCSKGLIPDYYHKTCSRCWKGCAECRNNECIYCEPGYFHYVAKIYKSFDPIIITEYNFLMQCANPCPVDSIFIQQINQCLRCDFVIHLGCNRCNETECFWDTSL